jgi:Spy/CpxP family protein refolding chaperone
MALLTLLAAPALWADEPHGGPMGQDKGSGEHGGGMKGRHGGAGHFLRHLLMHQKEIGLSEEQIGKIKTMQFELDKTRIRTEADVEVIERELDMLVPDQKADLGAIEAKLKQSGALQAGLRLAAIKAKRESLALLTPEQREKERAEHEKMMKMRAERRMKGMEGMGRGMKPGGGPGGPPKEAPTH